MRSDGGRAVSTELHRSVGCLFDVGSGSPASNVCGADQQRPIAKRVRELDPDSLSTGADVHDEAKRLVMESLDSPWHPSLGSRRPRSYPGFLRSREQWRSKPKQVPGGEGNHGDDPNLPLLDFAGAKGSLVGAHGLFSQALLTLCLRSLYHEHKSVN